MLKSFRIFVTLTLSAACGILTVIWPGWLTELRAQGYRVLPGAERLALTTETESDMQLRAYRRRLKKARDEKEKSSSPEQKINRDREFPLLAAAMPSSVDDSGASADGSWQIGTLGLFLTGLGSFGSQQATSREPGSDFHTLGFAVGGDYRLIDNLMFGDNLILGGAFGYLRSKAKFDTAGDLLMTNGLNLSTYGSYFVHEMYLEGIAMFGWNRYDSTRDIAGIDETAEGNTDGTQLALSIGGGYNFAFGPVIAVPTARVNYRRIHIDSFQEREASTSNSKFDSQNTESLTTDFGGQVYYTFRLPWVRFEWEHEFENDSRIIVARSVANPAMTVVKQTNDPDRDYFNLGVGLVATLRGGASAFAYYETVLGKNYVTNHSFSIGVRFAFE